MGSFLTKSNLDCVNTVWTQGLSFFFQNAHTCTGTVQYMYPDTYHMYSFSDDFFSAAWWVTHNQQERFGSMGPNDSLPLLGGLLIELCHQAISFTEAVVQQLEK